MALHRLFQVLVWGPVIVLTSILISNTLPYYWSGLDYGMLPEKAGLRESPLYLTLFYLHVGPSILLLTLPLFQFWFRVRKSTAKWHARLGNVYVYTTLLVVVPTGLYLSLYAKGGAFSKWGFATQGILLAICTWLGWRAIRKGNKQQHIEWMVRSFGLATAALTFRVLHIVFFEIGMEELEGYAASQWVSTFTNLLLAEIAVSYIRSRRAKKKASTTEAVNSQYVQT